MKLVKFDEFRWEIEGSWRLPLNLDMFRNADTNQSESGMNELMYAVGQEISGPDNFSYVQLTY